MRVGRIVALAASLAAVACSESPTGTGRPSAGSPAAVGGSEVNPAPADLLREVAELHRQGRVQEALERTEDELERDPSRLRLRYNLGVFRGSLGDHQGAAEAFQQELELDPDHHESRRALAFAFTRLGQLEDSIPHFEACLAAAPEDTACAFQLGRSFSSLGLLEDAEPHLEMAADRLQDATSQAELGMLLRRRGELERAISAFARALADEPEHLTTLVNYGQTLLALGRTADGEALLARHQGLADLNDRLEALERTSGLPGAGSTELFALANLYLEAERPESAAAVYERLLEAEPNHPIAALELASLYLDEDRLGEAEALIDGAAKVDPSSPAPGFYRGLLALKRGDRPAAQGSFNRSQRQGGWPPSAFLDVAAAYREIDDLASAATAFGAARDFDPESVPAWVGLAEVLYRRGDRGRAQEAAQRAVTLDAGAVEAWNLLGILRFEAGDSAGAEEAFEHSVAAERLQLLAEGGADRLLRAFPGGGGARILYQRVLQGAAGIKENGS